MDPERADSYDAKVVACHACAARDRTSRAFLQQDNADTAGVKTQIFETEG